jgi:hypothetical protein
VDTEKIMKMKSTKTYAERLVDWCDKTMQFLGWDLDAEMAEYEKTKSRRIYMDENLKKTVLKAKTESEVSWGLGITSLYNLIANPGTYGVGFVSYFGYEKPEDFTRENLEGQQKFAEHVMSLTELYHEWKNDEFAFVINAMSNNDMFDGSELDIDPEMLQMVNKLVLDRKFDSSIYRDGGDRISQDDRYYISRKIGFSTDITLWLEHVKNQQEFLRSKDNDEVFITLFGHLDQVSPIYSNWLFTIHKGDTIWIMSDQLNFDNPYQKKARLGRAAVHRDREELLEACSLPYHLFLDLELLRSETNSLMTSDAFDVHEVDIIDQAQNAGRFDYSKMHKRADELFRAKLGELGVQYDVISLENSGSYTFPKIEHGYAKLGGNTVAYLEYNKLTVYKRPEFLFKNAKELPNQQKSFLVMLCAEFLKYLSSDNVKPKTVVTAREFMDLKLLESAEIDPTSESKMKFWKDSHKEIFDELNETLGGFTEDGKTSALALKSYDMVKKSKHFDNSWLSTPEKLESLSEWIVLEDERERMVPLLKKLEDTRDAAFEWLYEKLNEDYDAIMRRVSEFDEIKIIGRGFDSWSSNPEPKTIGSVDPANTRGVDSKRGKGAGKYIYREEECHACNKNGTKHVKGMSIRHYKALMWLFGFEDRNQLHPYFRQYRAHNMIPYSGNSLLDQTHPYLRFKDPCSERHPNGLGIGFYMCGSCHNKMKKQVRRGESTKIEISK